MLDFINSTIPIGLKNITDPPLSGALTIKGKAMAGTQPYLCRVRLLESLTGRKLMEVATDAVGRFVFNGLQNGQYTVIAIDPSGLKNAVIATNVRPK